LEAGSAEVEKTVVMAGQMSLFGGWLIVAGWFGGK
jgi:hypothetical protein